MKKSILLAMLFVLSFKAYSDCRLPLVGDIQVAMNLRITLDKKIGTERRYSEFMPLSKAFQRSPDSLKKLAQIPIVPLYVVIDMMVAPIIPFDNAYKWFVNRGIKAKRTWYEKVSPGWDKNYISSKGKMLGLILESYQGKGKLLSKVSKQAGRSVKETARLVKLHNAVGYKLCRNPQISIKDFSKILKKGK